jgi:hypothetical protein
MPSLKRLEKRRQAVKHVRIGYIPETDDDTLCFNIFTDDVSGLLH